MGPMYKLSLRYETLKIKATHLRFELLLSTAEKTVPRPCLHENSSFIGAFAELRKATVSFVTSVRLYVYLVFCPHGINRLPLDGSA
jgi:hypothetical protein